MYSRTRSAHSHSPQIALDQNGSASPSKASVATSKKLGLPDGLRLEDPDDVLTKHTVHEVKTILVKLRSEVDAKQEELRLMVGERYRDLLEASTSIISMAESSKRVVDTIGRMKHMVSADPRDDKLSSRRSKVGHIDDAQLKIYQCLAAHLKFLVDASEHLWRLLERKQCLHAAWLFLLSRVVYRSLMDETSDEGQSWIWQGIRVKEQFPLVQRQWDSVSQFRSQISHRATLSLREQDLTPQDLCASMFTLHLLDSLPLPDALDVFLKQRSRTLQHLYQIIKESWEKQPDSSTLRTQKASSELKSIWDVIRSVLACVVGTVGNARAVFGETSDGSPSMIVQMLSFTQTDTHNDDPSLPPDLRLSSHSLISSLPNASHFHVLPADIRSYRPFIDLDSPSSRVKQETLDSKLRAWFTKAIDQLHETSGPWLSHLQTIKNAWGVRSSAMEWLSVSCSLLDPQEIEALRRLVDDVCRSRVQVLWKAMLENISRSFRETLQSTALAIAEGREDTRFDLAPPEFLLSAPPAPSVSHSSLNVPFSHTSFQRFKQGIRLRLDGMTPYVDRILSETEHAALSLRNDLDYALADGKENNLRASYVSDSETVASNLLDSLEHLLDADEGDSEPLTRRTYFLGRLSQKLPGSSMMVHLYCSDAFSESWHARARQIYDSCVSKCASAVALSASNKYAQNMASRSRGMRHDSPPSGPSSEIIDALLFLVESLDKFAQFKDISQRATIARIVLTCFSRSLVTALGESGNSLGFQSILDVSFLKAICDDWGEALSEPVASLDQMISQSYQSLPSDIKAARPNLEELQRVVVQSLRNVRLLLSPLVVQSDPPSSLKSPKSPALELGRKKLVGSPLGEVDVQPTLNLVKPPPRFGLLWVGTATTQ